MKLPIAEKKKQVKEFLDFIDTFNNCGHAITTLAPEGAREFYKLLQIYVDAEEPLPEKSTALLTFMQENKEKYNNLFTSAAIATEMGISGKSVGGSMRSLVSKGYVTKIAGTPVVYQLTN